MRTRQLMTAVASLLAVCRGAAADDVRTVTDDQGQTWREVHRTVQWPVTETQCLDRQQVVYHEKVDVQMCDSVRTYQVPVTEWRVESYWRGRYNPFVEPYLAQRMVPYTRWETRTEVVKVPITHRDLVPVTQTVKTPYTTQRLVSQDVLVSRQLVTSGASSLAATPAPIPSSQSTQIGGIARYDRLDRQPPARVAAPATLPTAVPTGSAYAGASPAPATKISSTAAAKVSAAPADATGRR
jgi:hypothetical protein